jgi:hypothetical protein
MATRKKNADRQKTSDKDARETRKFFIILGIVTVVLMLLVYYLMS